MHERAIAQELVDQSVALAREKGMSRITRIRVGLGEDSHETEEALQSWFDIVKAGTMAEQTVLEIERGKESVTNGIILLAMEGEAPDAEHGSSSQP